MSRKKRSMKDVKALLNAQSGEQLAKEIERELELQIPDPEYTLAELLAEEEKLKEQDKITAKENFREQEEHIIDLMDAVEKSRRKGKMF
jgi:hypothetical protein